MGPLTHYILARKKECQLSKIAAFYIVICVVLWISYHTRWAVGKTTSRVIVAVSRVLLCKFDTGWVKIKYLSIPNRLKILISYIFALPRHPYIPALHMKSNTKLCFCISLIDSYYLSNELEHIFQRRVVVTKCWFIYINTFSWGLSRSNKHSHSNQLQQWINTSSLGHLNLSFVMSNVNRQTQSVWNY